MDERKRERELQARDTTSSQIAFTSSKDADDNVLTTKRVAAAGVVTLMMLSASCPHFGDCNVPLPSAFTSLHPSNLLFSFSPLYEPLLFCLLFYLPPFLLLSFSFFFLLFSSSLSCLTASGCNPFAKQL